MRKHFAFGASLALAVSAVVVLTTIPVAASSGTWSSTADMQTISGGNSAVRLQDARVLVVSGTCWNCPGSRSSE